MKAKWILLALGLFLLQSPLFTDPLRIPQVAIGDSWDSVALWDLAPTALDGTIFANQDETWWRESQSATQLWTSDGTASFQLEFELAGQSNQNTCGIYGVNAAGELQYLEIFSGTASPTSNASVSLHSDGSYFTVTLNGNLATAITIAGDFFGFYLEYEGTYFYSEDSRNENGNTQMLAYNGQRALDPGENPGAVEAALQWLLAWEDLSLSGSTDQDYNDMGVFVKGMRTTVPEPASLVLLGLGLVALGAAVMRSRRGRL